MFQELITYIIVAVAIGLAIWKTYKKLAVKKRNRETSE
jgi:hypothetical protein